MFFFRRNAVWFADILSNSLHHVQFSSIQCKVKKINMSKSFAGKFPTSNKKSVKIHRIQNHKNVGVSSVFSRILCLFQSFFSRKY